MSQIVHILISSTSKLFAFAATTFNSLIGLVDSISASAFGFFSRIVPQISQIHPNNIIIHIILLTAIAALLYSMSYQNQTLRMANRAYRLAEERDALRVERIQQLEEMLELQERTFRLREAPPPPYQAARPRAAAAGPGAEQGNRVNLNEVLAMEGLNEHVARATAQGDGAVEGGGGPRTVDQGTQAND